MPGRKIIKARHFFEEDFSESLAEVPVEKIESWGTDTTLNFVGKPIPRIDGYDKVSGTAKYTFDIKLPHLTYAKILHSPLPHAKIKSIDTSQAKKLPGVLYILTHENCPPIKWWGVTFLFDPHLRNEGDEVACVVATSEKGAEAAAKLIKVEYENLPFVIDPEKAMQADAPKLYDNGNILGGGPSKYSRGDMEKGFAEADFIVEDTITTQIEVHNPTEPFCSVVNWDGDQLTVWDSTQSIFSVRSSVAGSLNIPESHVRVIKKYMGGGFGSKLEGGKYTVIAAIISREIGRPVKIYFDRKQMNLNAGNRPDSVQKLKAGAKKDGTLTALSHYSYAAVGAHPSGGGCSWPLRSIYKCSNVNVEEYSVMINAGRARPFRAPGHVQGTVGLEAIIDELAEKTGMDPLDFRLKNYAEVDPVSNQPYTTKRLRDAYLKGSAAIGWNERQNPAGSQPGTVKIGVGMATQIWWGGGSPPAYTTMKMNGDGSVEVLCGTQDIGTGTYTFMAQIAAEVLEIPIEKVSPILGDTATCPYGPASGGSMTAPSVAPAVRDAAEQMKAKLMSGGAALLELPEKDLRYHQGVITSVKDEKKSIKIDNIVRRMRLGTLVTTGAREANPNGYQINTFGAQFAKVAVDTETGKVKVLKIVAAHDIGRVLNKMTLENQFHGGIMQGLGFALMEERVIDPNTGLILTKNLHDYKVPLMLDTPEIEVIIVSDGDPLISNMGVKGCGEPAMIPTAAAIANAVYNAIGIRIKSLPITPDKVLMALQG
ncbi:xanthine dehydrogenase family protein molybdopterin-binding subunit [candidate division KSB1 bacterium]|nr:xanthine dehydrogenase family protein molybdopterin-binding subunit [candidate division KSB1 bacterium]